MSDVISHRFPVAMVRRSLGSSIPLGSGTGSLRHREPIVYSRLGTKKNEMERKRRRRRKTRGPEKLSTHRKAPLGTAGLRTALRCGADGGCSPAPLTQLSIWT